MFSSSGQKDDDGVTIFAEIDPISGAEIDLALKDAAADALDAGEIAKR